MNMITLKAPEITPAQRKELQICKQNLEGAIRDVESANRKVSELRKKESSLEKEAASLHRKAAQFDRDAEIKLAATLKQIERVHEAITAHDDKQVELPRIIDLAQELISKLCQASFHELMDQIGSALAPYYPSFNDARYTARSATAVNDLVTRLLAQRVERSYEAAKDTLRKVDALLTRSEIWSYQGAEVPSSEEPEATAA